MPSRYRRSAVLPGLGLLVLGTLALSACASGSTASGTATPVSDVSAAPVSVAAPATAAVRIAAHSAKATHGSKPSKKASATSVAAAAGGGPASGGGASAALPAAAAVGGSAGTVYGVSDPDLLSESAAVQVQQLQSMKAMGFTTVRVDASWYWGQQSGPGNFDWTSLDQVVASLRKVGMSADFDIDQCPAWAAVSGAQGNQWAQPANAAAYGTWAGAVAARYASKGVKYFEIWNEPNINQFWAPTPDPAAYTAILKAGYSAVKAAVPSAIVISGGLAPAGNTSTSYDPRTFLQDMYADGAGGSFDGVGDHPYSYPTEPDDVESYSGWSQMSQTIPSLRSIMTGNGDAGKKIWVTEYGAPTSGPNNVGVSGQTTELVQAISQASKLNWLGSFYLYTWADIAGSATADNGFGLLNEDNSQKPAYSAVASVLSST
jgi:hypothetical protein